jgi:hypothetical protein
MSKTIQPIATFQGGTFSELIKAYGRQRFSRDQEYKQAVLAKIEGRRQQEKKRSV